MPVKATRVITPQTARRLAIVRQRLAGPQPAADCEGIMDVMQSLRYLQIDPMRVVAPSHLLVLWSRIGPYDSSLVDTLLWKERRLIDDWAQATSIVLTEDYPIFSALKRGFAAGDSAWEVNVRGWMKKNRAFSSYILGQLRSRGQLLSNQFEDKAAEPWTSTGWTAGRNVEMMLTFLKAQGKVMIANREGNQRLWDLTKRFLPEWTPKDKLSDHDLRHRVAESSLRALGAARAKHIQQHYIRGCIRNIESVLAELENEGRIVRVEIREGEKTWAGPWYVHTEDLQLLDSLEAERWRPRTTLLSPFDNLITDRKRTEQLFGFHYRFEVYTPEPKRRYGCYVMPILHGDTLIGRIDPLMDRKTRRLIVKAVHAEPEAPNSGEVAEAVVTTIEELGTFLGAKEVCHSPHVPSTWKKAFR